MQLTHTVCLTCQTSFLRSQTQLLKVMQEMFEASVDGEAYDADRWSHYFRPSGMQARTGDPTKAASQAQLQLAKVLRHQ